MPFGPQPPSRKRRGAFWLAAGSLGVILAIVLLAWATSEDFGRELPEAFSPTPTQSSSPTPTQSPNPSPAPRVKAIAGMIPVGEGGLLIGSTQQAGSDAERAAVLIRTSPEGEMLWTRLVQDDPWYLGSAASPYGPTLVGGYRVEVLDEEGGTAGEFEIPSTFGYPMESAWMGETLIVLANPKSGPGGPESIKANLFALASSGEVLWSESLAQGYPKLVGGTSSAFLAIQRGEKSDVYRIGPEGLGQAQSFDHAFLDLAQTPWGVVVGASSPENTYYLLDETGEQFQTGQIPHSEGWLSALVPVGDHVAILTNGEDFGTTITVLDREGMEQQVHVSSEDPLGVWATSTGISVAGVLTESEAVPLLGDVTILELELDNCCLSDSPAPKPLPSDTNPGGPQVFIAGSDLDA